MGHDELFQRISVDLGLNNAFIGLKMSSKLNDLPEHFTPRPELQVTFNEIDAGFLQLNLGLNRTGNMSFLTRQDRTPKFVRQVLADRTESGLIF